MSAERVERILDAAYVCFTRHGVRRTTIDDIARQSGMSRGAVYQCVRNKQEAFRLLASWRSPVDGWHREEVSPQGQGQSCGQAA